LRNTTQTADFQGKTLAFIAQSAFNPAHDGRLPNGFSTLR